MPATGADDYAVLGGGTAGCVLAVRLSEDPSMPVCLVEAGPDHGPYRDGRRPADPARDLLARQSTTRQSNAPSS